MSTISNNKRLAINTMLLYFRMLLIMIASLFATRIVLNTLGVLDYGIYTSIGAVAATFGIITGSLTAAVSRYLNIEMGRGNHDQLQKIFSTSLLIHVSLALFILLIAEFTAPWFIEHKMTIPADRMTAAIGVFHCSILTFAINLISIPYTACIISHENMKVYAYISIVEMILTLSFVYLLSIIPYDKLIVYAIMMMLVVTVKLGCYQIYCRKNYTESHFHFIIDRKLMKEMFGFASWNMIGSTSVILSDQGVNILLNIFCNPIVNAARGLAMQVNQAVNSFAQNFMTALNPQITKSFGAGDLDTYQKTMIHGGRFAMSLLTLLALPILVETEYILHLWLDQVPDYAIIFVRLILLYAISESMSTTFITGLLATGKIMKLQLLVGGCRMLNFPLSYVALRMGYSPESTILIAILLSQVNLLIRLHLLKEYIPISIKSFYGNVVFKELIAILLPIIAVSFVIHHFPIGFMRLIASTVTTSIVCLGCLWTITCSKSERTYITNKVKDIISKKRKV